jgi:hypothetical protein
LQNALYSSNDEFKESSFNSDHQQSTCSNPSKDPLIDLAALRASNKLQLNLHSLKKMRYLFLIMLSHDEKENIVMAPYQIKFSEV